MCMKARPILTKKDGTKFMPDDPCKNALPECMEKISGIREKQISMDADIKHIKGRIDNGMSKTLTEISQKLSGLIPKIEHHGNIVKRIEDIGWLLAKFILIALLLVVVWAAANGWQFR